jgi:hypothetical protein
MRNATGHGTDHALQPIEIQVCYRTSHGKADGHSPTKAKPCGPGENDGQANHDSKYATQRT